MMHTLRTVYFVCVFVGFIVAVSELAHARWVYRELSSMGPDRLRLLTAANFVREGWFSTSVQACLVVIAVIGLVFPQIAPPFGLLTQEGLAFLPWIVASQLAHIIAAILLTGKVLASRLARLEMADAVSEGSP